MKHKYTSTEEFMERTKKIQIDFHLAIIENLKSRFESEDYNRAIDDVINLIKKYSGRR